MRSIILARQFVAWCLVTDSVPYDLLKNLVAEDEWDWESVVKIAIAENVLPTVAQNLIQEPTVFANLPTELAEFLLLIRRVNHGRNSAIRRASIKLAKLLNTIDVEPVLLKGAAYLFLEGFAGISNRFIGDLDFLVPASDTAEVHRLLLANGYKSTASNSIAISHHCPPIISPEGVTIELHYSVGLGKCASLLPSVDIIKSAQLIRENDVRLRIPSPPDIFSHHVLHSQIHEPYPLRIWPSFRTMLDLVMLKSFYHLHTQSIWTAVHQRFTSHGLAPLLATYVSTVERTFNVSLGYDFTDTWPIRLTRLHRELLNRLPLSRFLDPFFLTHSVITPRVRLLKGLLYAPGGWRYLLSTPFRGSFYQNAWREINFQPKQIDP